MGKKKDKTKRYTQVDGFMAQVELATTVDGKLFIAMPKDKNADEVIAVGFTFVDAANLANNILEMIAEHKSLFGDDDTYDTAKIFDLLTHKTEKGGKNDGRYLD